MQSPILKFARKVARENHQLRREVERLHAEMESLEDVRAAAKQFLDSCRLHGVQDGSAYRALQGLRLALVNDVLDVGAN